MCCTMSLSLEGQRFTSIRLMMNRSISLTLLARTEGLILITVFQLFVATFRKGMR